MGFVDQERLIESNGASVLPDVGRGRPDLGVEALGGLVLNDAPSVGRQTIALTAWPREMETIEVEVLELALRYQALPIALFIDPLEREPGMGTPVAKGTE